jgi:hypothetical protein
MIALRCSNCDRVQELENAFAGCVCRCRFCRAIQTVPKDSPRVTPGQEVEAVGTARPPVLLHCPATAAVEPPVAVVRSVPAADRTLMLGVGLAAVLALGAAGGAIVLLRALEADDGPAGPASGLNRVQYNTEPASP